MDLGIKGRKAIVCASSKGLGRACAFALAEAGVDVVLNGRNADVLHATAEALRATYPVNVTEVVGDLSTAEGRAALLAACPNPDILINNNGGPPPKGFRQMSHDDLIAGVEANMIAPIALMQAVLARQAAVKAFLYNWRWIGLGIALCGPLVLLMRKAVIRKTPGGPVAEL